MEWVAGHDQFIGKLMERHMQEYEVVITGSFRKTITVNAINEEEAALAVEDHPWDLEYEDITDYEIEDVFVD
jgi:hypothetical protein